MSDDEYIEGTLFVGHDEAVYFIPDEDLGRYRVGDEDVERAREILAGPVGGDGGESEGGEDEVVGFGFGGPGMGMPTADPLAGFGGPSAGQMGLAHGSFGVRSGGGLFHDADDDEPVQMIKIRQF